MKTKTLKLTAILLIFAGAFTACNGKEYPFLSIDKTTITVPAEGGTFTILVSSNGNWTAVVQDAASNLWLTLNNTSGINDGVITVNVEKNPLSETRSTKILISMGSLNETVIVSQEAVEVIFPIEIPFTEYSIPWQCLWRFEAGEYCGKVVIINNKEEFEKHFNCWNVTLSEIDFSKYSLLLAQGMGDIWYYPTYKSLQQISAQNFVLEVNLLPTVITNISGWKAAVLIDKIPDDMNVELNITKNIPEHSIWRATWGSSYIELTFYPSINRVQVKTNPDPLPFSHHFFGGGDFKEYYIVDDRMYFPFIDPAGNLWKTIWTITYPSENEMRLTRVGHTFGEVGMYNFILQTKFREK